MSGDGKQRLVIVESPAKARTISRYLGPGYEVESSIGHIRDLPEKASQIPAAKREKYGALGVAVDDDFEPYYAEAESLYLEGNQQFQKDAQTIATLQQLQASIDAGDPYAQAQYDALYFIAVSGTDLEPAFQAAAEQDASDPGFWHDPQSDDAYQESLFGSYGDEKEKSDALRKEGDAIGDQGDQLGFYTALMAITLFLLGIAAVVKRPLMRWVLIAAGMAIFTVTAVLTAMIPFVWVGY